MRLVTHRAHLPKAGMSCLLPGDRKSPAAAKGLAASLRWERESDFAGSQPMKRHAMGRRLVLQRMATLGRAALRWLPSGPFSMGELIGRRVEADALLMLRTAARR